jgi:hypothetical protein
MTGKLRRAASGLLLWGTALTCLAIGTQLRQMGTWLPSLPARIGDWTATDVPMDLQTRQRLGNPGVRSRTYANIHGERVRVDVVAPTEFLGFGELASLSEDFRILARAQRNLSGGTGSASASVHESLGIRGLKAHCLRWLQLPGGEVLAFEPDRGSGTLLRFSRGLMLAGRDPRACLVHVTTLGADSGASVGQIRRNLDEVAVAVVGSLRQEGFGQ